MDGECCSREEFVKHFVPSAFGFLGTQVCVRGGLALAITSSGWQLDDGSFFFVLVATRVAYNMMESERYFCRVVEQILKLVSSESDVNFFIDAFVIPYSIGIVRIWTEGHSIIWI